MYFLIIFYFLQFSGYLGEKANKKNFAMTFFSGEISQTLIKVKSFKVCNCDVFWKVYFVIHCFAPGLQYISHAALNSIKKFWYVTRKHTLECPFEILSRFSLKQYFRKQIYEDSLITNGLINE